LFIDFNSNALCFKLLVSYSVYSGFITRLVSLSQADHYPPAVVFSEFNNRATQTSLRMFTLQMHLVNN